MGSLLLAGGWLVAGGAAALDPAGPEPPDRMLREGARPGDACPLGGCRTPAASPWTAAAFGAAVAAIGLSARRREIRGL